MKVVILTGGEPRDCTANADLPDVNFDTTQMPVHLQLFNVLLQVQT